MLSPLLASAWNKLPLSLRQSSSAIDSFKSKLKIFSHTSKPPHFSLDLPVSSSVCISWGMLYTLSSQWEFLPWETWVAFPKESQVQQGACWVFSCFHNPPNFDMDYGIFNVRMWSFIIFDSEKLSQMFLVLLMQTGFEPRVFGSQVRCSTDWAILCVCVYVRVCVRVCTRVCFMQLLVVCYVLCPWGLVANGSFELFCMNEIQRRIKYCNYYYHYVLHYSSPFCKSIHSAVRRMASMFSIIIFFNCFCFFQKTSLFA